MQGGDPYTARGAPGYVLGVGHTEQTFSCQPDGVVSGTQPVWEPVRCSAPKGDSEHGEDVCSDSADESSCEVSWVSGHSTVEDRAVWTRVTTDSGTDGGLLTSEPQAGADLTVPNSGALERSGRTFLGFREKAWLGRSPDDVCSGQSGGVTLRAPLQFPS